MEPAPAADLRPPHVRADQLVDFDITSDITCDGDLHLGLRKFQGAVPDIFWTPRNGGHWVATRFALIKTVHMDWATFSSAQTQVPVRETAEVTMIPINLDPPLNAPFRIALMKFFSAAAVRKMEPAIRETAAGLVAKVADQGQCELGRSVALALPVSIFMRLIGMPSTYFAEFRELVVRFFESLTDPEAWPKHIAALQTATSAFVEEKKSDPGDDLITFLLTMDVNGRRFTDEEVKSVCFLLMLGGLDSVGTATLFAFYALARDPELQARLVARPDDIPTYVDEILRRHGFVHTSRIATRDVELAGAARAKPCSACCRSAVSMSAKTPSRSSSTSPGTSGNISSSAPASTFAWGSTWRGWRSKSCCRNG
jgi:cytochrome P450